MKTTAKEKFLRMLEKNVEEGAKVMTLKEFRKHDAAAHDIVLGIIRQHKSMIELWTAMDRRVRAKAKQIMRQKGR